MSSTDPHIVIVGGGASGALLAISLLRTPRPPRVTVIEARPLLARGFAYGEAAPFHLLNVRAANMSAYPDAPDHLLDWLDRTGTTAGVTGEGRFRFVPRQIYGRYLGEQLDAALASPSGRDRFEAVTGEAVSLRRTDKGLNIGLADGREVVGDTAILATGYALRSPSAFPRRLPSWQAFDASSLAKVGHVLIVGTGHSAIDHVQLLTAAGYQGKITLMSRRGLLPEVHKPVEPARIAADEAPFGARMSEVWRWFRSRSAAAAMNGLDWRSVLDGMRPHAQQLWQSLSVEEQRRFIRHARAWYDVRRHRLAPSISAALERLKSEGRLDVITGRIVAVNDKGTDAEVVYRRRGESEDLRLNVQGIIECTGFDLDPRRGSNPVLSDLLAQGVAQDGPHGFGLRVSPSCALIDAKGQAAADLYAIGPLTRGQFWESISLPDIRQQCAVLAEALTRQHVAA